MWYACPCLNYELERSGRSNMLELKNISFEVANNGRNSSSDGEMKEIIKDVNLTIEDKSFFVITGPNGGGKSTLGKLIAGIEKPTGGRILFDGSDITDMSVTERARLGISYAFQQPVRFKGITIKDLIALAAGRPLSVDDACVYLSEVGLCAVEYVNREADASLSGGELKRIEIAMVIARGTALSIFDEPEAGIDLWSFHKLIRVFEKLRENTDGSIIIISHQERILDIADKIVVLSGGRVINSGSKDDILPDLLSTTGVESCRFFTGKG